MSNLNSRIMPSELNASLTKITYTEQPRHVPLPGSPEELSHSYCTDHMLTVRWTANGGWETPEVRPFENLSISPTASVLHYATECFEGMKVYRGYDGKLRLFRPDCNGERLVMSAERASLPSFGAGELKGLIGKLMQVDGPRWLPRSQPGRFLYLRPTLIATQPQLGVQIPQEALLFIIAVSWPEASNPRPQAPIENGAASGTETKQPKASALKLFASTPDTIRAWPGGFGYAKLGANYGPALRSHGQAQSLGFNQVLWLFGPERIVTEAGASNFFVVWKNRQSGRLELVTPGLENQLILAGVTRRSVLELAKERLGDVVEVVERRFGIDEVEQAWREGRIMEAFVSGTAFFISPVSTIRNGDLNMEMSSPDNTTRNQPSYACRLREWLSAIMFGNEDHKWAYTIEGEIENENKS